MNKAQIKQRITACEQTLENFRRQDSTLFSELTPEKTVERCQHLLADIAVLIVETYGTCTSTIASLACEPLVRHEKAAYEKMLAEIELAEIRN